MYIKRHLQEQIQKASKSYPVVMVCGQRQVGKSTMLYHMKEKKRNYVTLDELNARRLAEEDPALFFDTYEAPLLIDEFQRVPGILTEIKRIVDEKALHGEDSAGLYWLTGSQKFSMMKHVSESLAGRVAVFDMSSLSCSEIEKRMPAVFLPEIKILKERSKTSKKLSVLQVYNRIFRGGMPRIVADRMERSRYYMDYVNTYLERDVKELSQVGKLRDFSAFLTHMAARTGQELKYNDIATTIGVSAPTIKEWVSILERSGVVYILRPYYAGITKRLVRTPKVYFMDTGLAAYLCGWPDARTLMNGPMSGAFFETFVVTEIVKSYYNAGVSANLYYYRDSDKKEIDLLILDGRNLYPVEIKKNKNPAHPDANYQLLHKFDVQLKPMTVVCMSDELVPFNRHTWLCPVTLV